MKLLILERDGVINRRPTTEQVGNWTPLPGSVEALARLHKAGYTLVVATNQSGLGDGSLSLDQLEREHEQLTEAVEAAGGEVAAIFYCPHTDADQCKCRKPMPGMLDAIEAEFNLSVTDLPVIGDGPEDILAARAKGARPLLVGTGRGTHTRQSLPADQQPEFFATLADAVDTLLQERD